MAERIDDKIITLSDGRRLGYAEYGDPTGWPLMFFHGTPGSRIMARFAGPKAWELGVRLPLLRTGLDLVYQTFSPNDDF